MAREPVGASVAGVPEGLGVLAQPFSGCAAGGVAARSPGRAPRAVATTGSALSGGGPPPPLTAVEGVGEKQDSGSRASLTMVRGRSRQDC
ncbi:MAG: hypothetical protein CMJ84_11780 [Planctomycetes bacterium]|nr:hypothetical protein [Planctomycetota bacterium]